MFKETSKQMSNVLGKATVGVSGKPQGTVAPKYLGVSRVGGRIFEGHGLAYIWVAG